MDGDVTALLVGNGTGPGAVRGIAPRAHVTFYGSVDAGLELRCSATVGGLTYSNIGLGIRQALRDGNRIISISQGGTDSPDGDVAAIAQAIAQGVVVVVADPDDLGDAGAFPNATNGVVTTNAFQADGTLQTQDDGQHVAWTDTTVVAPGYAFPSQGIGDPPTTWGASGEWVRGSSLSTPLVAGMLALALQKYPAATGDQLIQSLIRNTRADDHPLQRDDSGFGYGPASLTHLLRVDPTRYPDENPLMNKPGGLGVPTAADVAAARATASAAPSGSASTSTSTAQPGPRTGAMAPSLLPVLAIGGVLLALAVIAGVIVLVVLLARNGRRTAGGMSGGSG